MAFQQRNGILRGRSELKIVFQLHGTSLSLGLIAPSICLCGKGGLRRMVSQQVANLSRSKKSCVGSSPTPSAAKRKKKWEGNFWVCPRESASAVEAQSERTRQFQATTRSARAKWVRAKANTSPLRKINPASAGLFLRFGWDEKGAITWSAPALSRSEEESHPLRI